uniref:Glycine zipper domain-containing protein n=1 Tax=Caenorhabditis japonica TaxID=281687 RepID=A0A8R1DJL2_CAEJA
MSSTDIIPASSEPGSSWFGSVGTAAGWVWEGVKVTGSVVNDLQANTTRNTVCTTATVTGGLLGGWSGGAIGATIGTMILPGVGTAVGSLVGSVSAGVVAGKATIVVANRVLDDMNYDIDTRSCEKCGRGFRCNVYKDGPEKLCYRCK